MNYLEMKKQLTKGEVHPIYFFYGTERYVIHDILQMIMTNTLTKEEMEFNYNTYDMKEVPIDVAVEEAMTLPFLGGKKLIVIKTPYFLTAAKEKDNVDHNLSMLEDYVASPNPETVMVIDAPYEKLDERKKLVKRLKKNTVVMEANPFDEKQLEKWFDEMETENRVHMTPEARQSLLMLSGKDVMRLASEINKMALYVGEGGNITKETVHLLVARSLEENVFALVDDVVHQRTEQALRSYYDLLKKNEDPIKILALFARQFRIIYQSKELQRRGYSAQKIASQIKIHPYPVKLALQQSKNYSSSELISILNELEQADYAMKTGKMDKKMILELFIAKSRKNVRRTKRINMGG